LDGEIHPFRTDWPHGLFVDAQLRRASASPSAENGSGRETKAHGVHEPP
jgi:hypothetical protein